MAVDPTYPEYIHEPNCRDLDGIPGTFGPFILGHNFSYTKDPFKFATEQKKKYGNLFKLNTHGQKGVVLLGADNMQRFYVDPDKVFSSRMGFATRMSKWFGNSMITSDWADHKLQRRMAQTAFKGEAIRRYTDDVNKIYDRFLDELEGRITKGESKIDFFNFLKVTLLQVAAETFLGVPAESVDTDKLNKAFIQFADGLMFLFPIDLPGFKYHAGLEGRRYLEAYIAGLVESRRGSSEQDMLTYFCNEKDERGNYFSKEDIADQMLFVLFAAHDTTVSALLHTVFYLCKDSSIKAKLEKEVLAIGKDSVTQDDFPSMTYMMMVFNEVQRYRPSVPALPRRTIKDVEIEGHIIPAHTIVMSIPSMTHYDEEYWSDPFTFDPERFSEERQEHKKHPFMFHPFGGGAHKCIGMHFSLMEYKCFMYKFLKRFDFEAVNKPDDVFMQTFPLPKPADNMPLKVWLR